MDWSNALAVTFTGIVVVFIALVLLVAIVSVFGMFTAKLTGGKKKADAVKAAPQAPAAPAANVVNAASGDDEIAAIMGAIAAIITAEGGNSDDYVITSITPAAGKRVRKPMPAWAAAGVLDNTAPF